VLKTRRLSPPCTAPRLLELLFSGEGDMDPAAALKFIKQLGDLRRGSYSALLKSVELLHHMTQPQRPSVRIHASAEQLQINAGDTGLGGRR
jgi:hypothetical protein